MNRNQSGIISMVCLIAFLIFLTIGDALANTVQETMIATVNLVAQEGDSRALALVLGLVVPVIILVLWALRDKRRQSLVK